MNLTCSASSSALEYPPLPRGLQVEVPLDINTNGISNVFTSDKATSNSNRIIITNDASCLVGCSWEIKCIVKKSKADDKVEAVDFVMEVF